MLEGIKFTFYEIVGYLLPGTLFLSALVIVFSKGNVLVFLTTETLLIILTCSYFLGHFIQGLSNHFLCKTSSPNTYYCELNPNVQTLIKDGLSQRIGLKIEDGDTIYEVGSKLLREASLLEEKEIYTYREGFYRGSFLSSTALAISVLFSSFFWGQIVFDLGDFQIKLEGIQAYSSFLLIFCISYVYYKRYIRFMNYRFNLIFSWLISK